jgi:hypothetical protein
MEPRWTATLLMLIAGLALLAGCASKRPVLYPNPKLERTGSQRAQQDIDACIALANAHGHTANSSGQVAQSTVQGGAIGGAAGAAGGAVRGRAGRGAATGAAAGGAAGFMRGLFRSREPAPIHKRFVGTCLSDKGYRVLGWD